MKTIASLFIAALAGYAWAHEWFLSAAFFLYIAFGLTELPSKISAAFGHMKSYIWRGINSWDRKYKNRLEIVLFVILAIAFYFVFEMVDRTIGVEQAFGSLGEFGAPVLLLLIFWLSVAITFLFLVLIGVAATIKYDQRRNNASPNG